MLNRFYYLFGKLPNGPSFAAEEVNGVDDDEEVDIFWIILTLGSYINQLKITSAIKILMIFINAPSN